MTRSHNISGSHLKRALLGVLLSVVQEGLERRCRERDLGLGEGIPDTELYRLLLRGASVESVGSVGSVKVVCGESSGWSSGRFQGEQDAKPRRG